MSLYRSAQKTFLSTDDYVEIDVENPQAVLSDVLVLNNSTGVSNNIGSFAEILTKLVDGTWISIGLYSLLSNVIVTTPTLPASIQSIRIKFTQYTATSVNLELRAIERF